MPGLLSADPHGPSRRAVLVGVGTAATLAACAGTEGDGPSPSGTPAPGEGTAPTPAGTTGSGTIETGSPAEDTGSATPGAPALVALPDVPVGGAVAVTTPDGEEILVAQPSAGQVVAFSAVCTHQGCIVAPDDDVLRCPCHGSRFDLATGDVLGGPADEPLPPVAVAVRGDDVVLG